MKKSSYFAFGVGTLLTLFTILLSFAASNNYNNIFLIEILCDVISLSCFVPLLRYKTKLRWIIIILLIVTGYTILDMILRFFFGTTVCFNYC